MAKQTGYELSRQWFDFSFENPDKIKPIHTALYFFACEHCNRLGGKDKFGLPSIMTMEAIGVKSHNTYMKAFNDLIEWGFITLYQKSTNQYSANIIALSKYDKALDKALDKASIKHNTKQSESTVQSTDDIVKQINNKQINNKQNRFNFRKELIEKGANDDLVSEWLRVRKDKKATNTKTALNSFISQVEKSGLDINKVLEQCVINSWKGFKSEWIKKEIKNKPNRNIAF
jgi:hypothetical protein